MSDESTTREDSVIHYKTPAQLMAGGLNAENHLSQCFCQIYRALFASVVSPGTLSLNRRRHRPALHKQFVVCPLL